VTGEKREGPSMAEIKTVEPSLVEIGIATRNRWEDLGITLARIAGFGLGHQRILIFDDASDQPCPYDVTSICKGAELTRFRVCEGCIVRRNQLARGMNSTYYLSLDDDSFPVGGSLEAAVDFAQSCENLLCLSFPIYNPVLGAHQVRSLQDTPYRVRSFIGCGHLLHRQRFLDSGGYCEDLVHQGEEVELAARTFQKSLDCYHFPGLQIHHTASDTGRSYYRMDYYGSRNNVLWNDWYIPPALRIIKQSRTFVSRSLQVIRTRRLGSAQGHLAGLREISKFRDHRRPMSMSSYKEWKSLPSS
jgi:GT2 family glycosyltransferase